MNAKVVTAHWRFWLGIVIGIAAFGVARVAKTPGGSPGMIGYLVGAGVYLATTWHLFLKASEKEVRTRAANEDEGVPVIMLIIISAILASLVAIVLSLIEAKDAKPPEKALIAGLAGVTLLVSWLMLQTTFVLHYAHRHFSATKAKAPFTFPGEPARTYLDFVYISFCIGATFQISDNTINTQSMRMLITTHAAVAYFYNTAILALGINIIASLVG